MIAHIRSSDKKTQALGEHCNNVRILCAHAAKPLGLEQTAALIGILHDAGKATPKFEAYLKSAALGECSSPHNHAPTGAIYAYCRWFRGEDSVRAAAQTVAMCILGHHAGLCDCVSISDEYSFITAMSQADAPLHYDIAVANFIGGIISETELDAMFRDAAEEVRLYINTIRKAPITPDEKSFRLGMLTRLLLSILVDADRWDSACFEHDADPFSSKNKADWGALLGSFERFRRKNLCGTGDINRIRADISEQCALRAEMPPGVYTLCVPTGGGKTFSSLRFALRHAEKNKMARIFYIIPFNTILDQNAQDIRTALDNYASILEHHSNVILPTEDEQISYKRLTERWDSDIILTSMVQFLNACFSSSNTDARRFHALASSVLIFDEVQALPKHCLTLFERAVGYLCSCCGCTAVLCTATQPQLSISPRPTELVSAPRELCKKLKRVNFHAQLDKKTSSSEAAARLALMAQESSVLTIVNTKATAWDIYSDAAAHLEEGGYTLVTADPMLTTEQIYRRAESSTDEEILCVHMSTLLCPAHRQALLQWMKIWLAEHRRVFCVSTALIEAGINVSFPVVVRSLTQLPSIVQAAGRANRSMEYGMGDVYIWELCDEELRRLPDIKNGRDITRAILNCCGTEELEMPETVARYFSLEEPYIKKQRDYPLDGKTSVTELLSGNELGRMAANNKNSSKSIVLCQGFRTAQQAFRVIDAATAQVLIPFGEGEKLIIRLSGQLEMHEEIRLLRQAQRYSVSLHKNIYERLSRERAIYPVGESGTLALKKEYYNAQAGVRFEPGELEEMII